MKTCPECAEEVREAARLCRFCGHRFVDGERGETGRRDAASTRRRVRWAVAAGALAALVLVVLLASNQTRDPAPSAGSADPLSNSPAATTPDEENVDEPASTTGTESRPEPAPQASGDEPVRCDLENGCSQGDTPVPQVVQGEPCTTGAGEEGAWYGPGGDALRCTASPGELDPSEPVLCEYRNCSQDGKRIPALEFYEGMECQSGAEWTLVEESGDIETFECREAS